MRRWEHTITRDLSVVFVFAILFTLTAVLLDVYDCVYVKTRLLEVYDIDELIVFLPFSFFVGLTWFSLRRIKDVKYELTERKQAEEALQNTSEKLRKMLGGTINVLASTVEKRDPYTAGHQRRVADLARAIATERAFPKTRLMGPV